MRPREGGKRFAIQYIFQPQGYDGNCADKENKGSVETKGGGIMVNADKDSYRKDCGQTAWHQNNRHN